MEIPRQLQNFINAAESVNINVTVIPAWGNNDEILVCFNNVLDSESEQTYIVFNSDGYLSEE